MKNGIFVLTLSAIAGIFLLSATILTAADSPDEVVINHEGYKKDTKGSVFLSHAKHSEEYNIACDQCHHEYDAEHVNTWKSGDPVKKCTDCHDLNESDGDKKKMKLAYHDNCKKCHQEAGGEAPTKCFDCHAKDD
jgi:hypothetical protein